LCIVAIDLYVCASDFMSTIDLIAGVMASAKPDRLAKAEARLSSGRAVAADVPFGQAVNRLMGKREPDINAPDDLIAAVLGQADPAKVDRLMAQFAAQSPQTQAAAPVKARTGQDSLQQLEGMLLTSVLEAVVPKAKGTLFGDETGGLFWRGQQIEIMADQLGRRPFLDLADSNATQAIAGDYGAGRPIRAFAFTAAS
jgi:hypothetical protein